MERIARAEGIALQLKLQLAQIQPGKREKLAISVLILAVSMLLLLIVG